MSILRPINYAGAWEFRSPVPTPASDILVGPMVSISFNEDWIPAVTSAIKALTRPEAYVGSLGDINRCTKDAHCLFILRSGIPMQVGTIVPHVLNTLPSNWLACDGSVYLRADYPELVAVIDPHFQAGEPYFFVPDLRGRTVIGAGQGIGLTNRIVSAQVGEESHVLTVAELAQHGHSTEHIDLAQLGADGTVRYVATSQVSVSSGATGSNSPHNNMQPSYTLKYAIVAKS